MNKAQLDYAIARCETLTADLARERRNHYETCKVLDGMQLRFDLLEAALREAREAQHSQPAKAVKHE